METKVRKILPSIILIVYVGLFLLFMRLQFFKLGDILMAVIFWFGFLILPIVSIWGLISGILLIRAGDKKEGWINIGTIVGAILFLLLVLIGMFPGRWGY